MPARRWLLQGVGAAVGVAVLAVIVEFQPGFLVWRLLYEQSIRTFTGHSSYVHSVAFAPDGRTALSGGSDKTLKLWDVARPIAGTLAERYLTQPETEGGRELTLPPDGFWERREVGRLESLLPKVGTDLLAPLPVEHPWRAVVAAPAALGSAFGPGDLGTVSQARNFVLARRGLHRLDGGTTALHALFVDKLGTYAGEKRERLTPVEIVQQADMAASRAARSSSRSPPGRDRPMGAPSRSGPPRAC